MKYYVARNDQPAGPFEIWELKANGVTADTLVWHAGLPQWVKASEIPEVTEELSRIALPPTFDHDEYCSRMLKRAAERIGASRQDDFRRQVMYPRPNNYLAEAIVVTVVFCSLITGIIAIVKALNVNKLYDRGLYEQAERESLSARNWVIASVVIGIFSLAYMFF